MASLTAPNMLGRDASTHWVANAGLWWWLALCVGGGALIGLTSAGGDSPWYQALDRPSFTPPSWIFAPVWTTLYALMAVAAWRVWRQGGWAANRVALTLFLLQLAANFVWSPLFFNAHAIELALADLLLLWALLVMTISVFHRRDRTAAWLLLPYLAWVSFAGVLNTAFVVLN